MAAYLITGMKKDLHKDHSFRYYIISRKEAKNQLFTIY